MRPEVLGSVFNGGIFFFAGIYITLIGYRVIGKRPGVDLNYDVWHDRNARMLQVCGPLLAIFGCFLAAKNFIVGS